MSAVMAGLVPAMTSKGGARFSSYLLSVFLAASAGALLSSRIVHPIFRITSA
jgi:hypothetical protein